MRVKNSLTQGIMKEYVRFGEIPKDEHSKRGNRIVGDGYKCIGYEQGVSVWNTLKVNGEYCLVAPHGNSCTHGDFSSMAFPDDCYGCCKDDPPIYVVTGDEVGIGCDGEPLIKNISIIEKLPFDYFAFKKDFKPSELFSTYEDERI